MPKIPEKIGETMKIDTDLIQKYRCFELKGICLAGCVRGGKIASGYRAHAHISGRHKGWICFQSENPSKNLFLHEWAHILSGTGHDEKWAKILLKLGGRIDARYAKLKGISRIMNG